MNSCGKACLYNGKRLADLPWNARTIKWSRWLNPLRAHYIQENVSETCQHSFNESSGWRKASRCIRLSTWIPAIDKVLTDQEGRCCCDWCCHWCPTHERKLKAITTLWFWTPTACRTAILHYWNNMQCRTWMFEMKYWWQHILNEMLLADFPEYYSSFWIVQIQNNTPSWPNALKCLMKILNVTTMQVLLLVGVLLSI